MHHYLLLSVFLVFSSSYAELQAQIPVGSNQCFSKGGIGVTYQGVHVVVNSERNELRLKDAQSWVGAGKSVTEVVLIQNGQIVENPKASKEFDLTKCLVISFQPDRVIFFDFSKSKGGYYHRF